MSEEVQVHCTDKGRNVAGHILNYNPGVFLDVAINTVKVKLSYDSTFDQYVGSMAGLEWVVKQDDLPKDVGQYRR